MANIGNILLGGLSSLGPGMVSGMAEEALRERVQAQKDKNKKPDANPSDGSTPSYKDGIDNVPKTGPAILHKGEAVLPEPVAKVVRALGGAGKSAGVKPSDSESSGLAAKQGQIDEYQQSLQTPMSMPKPSGSSPKDKVNATARYGDRGSEKRIDTTKMVKPLGSFEDGGTVPQDGAFNLHEGEEVLNKDDAEDFRAKKRVSTQLASGDKKKPKLKATKGSKKVHKVTMHKDANNPKGRIVEHHFEGKKDPELHSFKNYKQARKHMDSVMGDMDQSGPEAPGPSPDDASSGNSPAAEPAVFADGGMVEKTGTAEVHKGEVVLPHPDNKAAWKTLPERLKGAGEAARAVVQNIAQPGQAVDNFRKPPAQKTPSAPDKDYSAYGAYAMRK